MLTLCADSPGGTEDFFQHQVNHRNHLEPCVGLSLTEVGAKMHCYLFNLKSLYILFIAGSVCR